MHPALQRNKPPDATSGQVMPAIDPTVYNLIIFVLAIFVGYYVVWSVTPALHTPPHVRDQRDLERDHRRRLIATGAAGLKAASWFGFLAVILGGGQHLRRVHRDPAHARHVPRRG